MILTYLLLGDHLTGKTSSVNSLGIKTQNDLARLYHTRINDQVINIWDTQEATTVDLPQRVILRPVNICLIFCNLNRVETCDRISYWYNLIQKYRPGLQIVIVALEDRETDRSRANQISVLRWCTDTIKGDLPYFKISHRSEYQVMYHQLTEYLLEFLHKTENK